MGAPQKIANNFLNFISHISEKVENWYSEKQKNDGSKNVEISYF